jgi:serine/threonine protein kinase
MADMWACGIITYWLMTGKHPFVQGEDKTEEIKDKILTFKEIKFPSSMSEMARHLISRLLTHEQSHRYSAAEALRHPWITRDLNA